MKIPLLIKLQKESKPHFNTLVLFGFEVYQLLDVIDGNDDLYYVTHSNRGIIHHSCVLGFVPLKGRLKPKDYKELVRVWNMNLPYWKINNFKICK